MSTKANQGDGDPDKQSGDVPGACLKATEITPFDLCEVS
jgi:hypothetical protein